MITADVHTHSSFSADSDEPLEKMVGAALEKGLKAICLTEHQDFDYPNEGEFTLDVPAYREELMRVREKYRDSIEVLYGAELGLLDYDPQRLYGFAKSSDFDFVIGSVHQADNMDPYYPEYFQKWGDKNGIAHFFDVMLSSVKAFDGFDVFGHFDYIVRYSKAKSYDPLDYREITDEILKALVAKGKGVEINTAGFNTLGYPHPAPFVLKRFRELGGETVTVGSDAHNGKRVAENFDKISALLESTGYKYYAVFRQRKGSFIRI